MGGSFIFRCICLYMVVFYVVTQVSFKSIAHSPFTPRRILMRRIENVVGWLSRLGQGARRKRSDQGRLQGRGGFRAGASPARTYYRRCKRPDEREDAFKP